MANLERDTFEFAPPLGAFFEVSSGKLLLVLGLHVAKPIHSQDFLWWWCKTQTEKDFLGQIKVSFLLVGGFNLQPGLDECPVDFGVPLQKWSESPKRGTPYLSKSTRGLLIRSR